MVAENLQAEGVGQPTPKSMEYSSLAGLVSRNRTYLMGIAILLIMLCHAEFRIPIWRILYPLYDIQRMLPGGVDVFFFLSGFGVCRSLTGNPDATAFFGRRIRRIYPIYLPIAVLWLVAVSILTPPVPLNSAIGILTGMGFWAQLSHQFMWFVSAILAFYLLSPYLHAFLTRGRNVHLRFAVLLLLTVLFSLPAFFTWQILAVSRFPVYIAGMYFCLAFDKRRRANLAFELSAYALMAVGLWLVVYMPYWVEDASMYYHGLFNYPYLIVVPGFCMLLSRLADLLRRCFLRFFVRFFEYLGTCCLELCLVHRLVFQVARELFAFNNWIRLALILVSILLSIGYARFMHWLLKRNSHPDAPLPLVE